MNYRYLVLGLLFGVGLAQDVTLRFPRYRIAVGLATLSVCGAVAISCGVYCDQKRRLAAAEAGNRRPTHLEVLRYIFCLAFFLTCCIDMVLVIKMDPGCRGFTYCALTLTGALFASLAVELLGECLHF